ncbi:hypothetical protein ACS5PN_00460 [Roseateles sp. NT4]
MAAFRRANDQRAAQAALLFFRSIRRALLHFRTPFDGMIPADLFDIAA